MAIPTASDKVILVDFSLTETKAFSLQPIDTQRQFSTTDRGTAFIGFKSENITNGMTADISLANLDDDSRVNRTFTVTTGTNFDATNKIFYYQIPDDEIVHWGNWIGYGKFTDGATSKTWTGTKLKYSISRDITNDPETKLIVMDDVNSFIASMQTIKNEMEADHAQALLDQTNYAGLLENGVMTTQIIAKLTELETTYAPDLFSVKQQLADTLNKSAITLTHMFADATARDAYFVAHPAELIELQFIKVGTGYQQYIEGAWQSSTAIVSEQLSATNQPIVDTGNYFATDNTNAALQELGAHKASAANPHGVTKAQVGLGNVDNTSDANKPVSTAQQTALNEKANKVQEAWITPTLLSGWTGQARYKKDNFNVVWVELNLSNGTGPTFFYLPTGYRPSNSITFIHPSSISGISFCSVDSAGPVQRYAGTDGTPQRIYISFRVD